jgi:hypothetical protein
MGATSKWVLTLRALSPPPPPLHHVCSHTFKFAECTLLLLTSHFPGGPFSACVWCAAGLVPSSTNRPGTTHSLGRSAEKDDWVDDGSSSGCQVCSTKFGLISNRKHHVGAPSFCISDLSPCLCGLGNESWIHLSFPFMSLRLACAWSFPLLTPDSLCVPLCMCICCHLCCHLCSVATVGTWCARPAPPRSSRCWCPSHPSRWTPNGCAMAVSTHWPRLWTLARRRSLALGWVEPQHPPCAPHRLRPVGPLVACCRHPQVQVQVQVQVRGRGRGRGRGRVQVQGQVEREVLVLVHVHNRRKREPVVRCQS